MSDNVFITAPWNMVLHQDTPEMIESEGEFFEKPVITKVGDVVGLWIRNDPDASMGTITALLHDTTIHKVDGEMKWLGYESYVQTVDITDDPPSF